MKPVKSRRQFIRSLGVSAASVPFLHGLPGIQAMAADQGGAKKRLIVLFSPNGTIPDEFWPEVKEDGSFALKRILKPLEPFQNRLTILRGVWNKVKGDGDRHMRGMSCLLTGTELFPGNIQGGSDSPAGWASGISIDQELKNFLQGNEATRTRFGSLEIGVAVPNRADPWTRMSYAGPNQPVAPVVDPEQLIGKLYGQMKDKESLSSVLDDVREDLSRVSKNLGAEDKALLDQHLTLVRDLENELKQSDKGDKELLYPVPEIDPNIELVNANTPAISRMQIDLLVNAMANDMTRIGSLQYMRSVGQARMEWLGIKEGHHGLSHEPDKNAEAVEQLVKINEWFAGEVAYLTKKLAETPEPASDGSMLDNTLVVWLNELGKGNSHTLEDIPFVLIGGQKSHQLKGGTYLTLEKEAHNRLWLKIAHEMGHHIPTFGTAEYCEGGPLSIA